MALVVANGIRVYVYLPCMVIARDIFSARRAELRVRQWVWWLALATFLFSFAWSVSALLQNRLAGVQSGVSFTPAALIAIGLTMLTLAFAIYRYQAHPWQPNRALNVQDPDPLKGLNASGWLALEQAFELAETLHRPLHVAHLLLGCFVTREGNSLLARLGITFDAVQEPFIMLVREGESTTGTVTDALVLEVLVRARQLVITEEGSAIGAVEIMRAALAAEPRLVEALEKAGADTKHVEGIGRWLAVQAALKVDHDTFVRLAALKPDSDLNRIKTARATALLNQVSEDLTRSAKQGLIAPVIERAEVWSACVRAWEGGERTLVLVGSEGVGKTAFIEGLARSMVEEKVPSVLFDKRLVSVHVAELVTGADPGVISERLLQLTGEVAQSGNIVLVLEGVEALAGAGYGGTRDLFEILSSEIERMGLYVIATTTPETWKTYLENRVFGKRSVKIAVETPTFDVAEAILMTHAGGLEYKHQVFFTYAALQVALETANQISSGLAMPGNALNWLREAAALTHRELGENALVGREQVGKVIEEKTGIPARVVQSDEAGRLLKLEEMLQKRVIGQVEAVTAVAQALRRARADVRDTSRPMASFLFLGPTGVGKTELAKALAQEYFGAEDRMIRLDLSEYQVPSSVTRLIGQPQDERGGLLTEAVRQKPYALILLDELEKAHPDILTLFLQVFDDGRLTDGMGRTIDFSHTIIIATSNAAASYIQDRVAAGVTAEQLRRELLERELKAIFRPEFLNRFDGVQVFHPLTMDDVTKIAWIMLRALEKRMEEKGIRFTAEDAAVEKLAHDGYDREFGARPLRRLLQDRVESQIADILLKKLAKRGDAMQLGEDGTVKVVAG